MLGRLFRQLAFGFFAGILAEQVKAFRSSINMSFFELLIDLILEYQSCDSQEACLQLFNGYKQAFDSLKADVLPDEVLESRILNATDGHLL